LTGDESEKPEEERREVVYTATEASGCLRNLPGKRRSHPGKFSEESEKVLKEGTAECREK
jgi:hypothetical protein